MDAHRPTIDELQATFAAQASAAMEHELKTLAHRYASVRLLADEAATLRARVAELEAKAAKKSK